MRACIDEYVNYMNINNSAELSEWIKKVGLNSENFTEHKRNLSPLFERRHLIVHQTDRNYDSGIGQHRAKSISVNQVERWTKSVERFAEAVLMAIPD